MDRLSFHRIAVTSLIEGGAENANIKQARRVVLRHLEECKLDIKGIDLMIKQGTSLDDEMRVAVLQRREAAELERAGYQELYDGLTLVLDIRAGKKHN